MRVEIEGCEDDRSGCRDRSRADRVRARVGVGEARSRSAAATGYGSDGFTLIELIVAISLLATVAGGFVASLGLGFKTIALARQRQTAASIAEARLEHLRGVPYSNIALPSGLSKSSDATNPDSGVSVDGTQYNIDGKGTMEPLVVASGGAVLHLEDPVTVGTTVMQIYQYVTWVDDAGIPGTQDYRRVTVIVVFKTPTLNGINLALSDQCTPIQARVGNNDGSWSAWTPYDLTNPLLSWAVTAGDGTKQVNVQATDKVGNSATIATLSVIVDTTKPTVPGTLTRTVSCSGPSRTVTLSWGIATDTNFRGYRIYRSTDGVTWSVFVQVSQTTVSDNTLKKTLDSVRYYVVAYDKAGNESNATNTIALSKNQCS